MSLISGSKGVGRSRVPLFSTGLLVDTNLETQTIETYRPPPPPVPSYDVDLRLPQTPPATQEIGGNKNNTGSAQAREPESGGSSIHSTSGSTEKIEDLNKEEEDVCPTCLEEYDDENPKMMTKCDLTISTWPVFLNMEGEK
ncbi:unnamed protein product [Rhodiola kirilowii]